MPEEHGRPIRIIMAAVLFNLICEFWIHGLIGFMNPVLIGSLIILYVTYFFMLEDLVVRYRFKDYHVLVVGIMFGLWHETFTTGSIFNTESLLGVNPVAIFISTVFWWGIMQSIAGLYFANRFFEVRDWNHSRLGRLGWCICLFFSLQAVQSVFRMPGSTLTGYVTILAILLAAMTMLVLVKKPSVAVPFRRFWPLDLLVASHIVLGLGMGFLYGSIHNLLTTRLFIIWSIIFGSIVVFYRFASKNAISI